MEIDTTVAWKHLADTSDRVWGIGCISSDDGSENRTGIPRPDDLIEIVTETSRFGFPAEPSVRATLGALQSAMDLILVSRDYNPLIRFYGYDNTIVPDHLPQIIIPKCLQSRCNPLNVNVIIISEVLTNLGYTLTDEDWTLLSIGSGASATASTATAARAIYSRLDQTGCFQWINPTDWSGIHTWKSRSLDLADFPGVATDIITSKLRHVELIPESMCHYLLAKASLYRLIKLIAGPTHPDLSINRPLIQLTPDLGIDIRLICGSRLELHQFLEAIAGMASNRRVAEALSQRIPDYIEEYCRYLKYVLEVETTGSALETWTDSDIVKCSMDPSIRQSLCHLINTL